MQCYLGIELLDRKRLIERVEATEAAIHGRLRDLQYDSDHHEERQLIADAQDTLALLRRAVLKRCEGAGVSSWQPHFGAARQSEARNERSQGCECPLLES